MDGDVPAAPGAPQGTGQPAPTAPLAPQPPAGPAPTTPPAGPSKNTDPQDVSALPEWAQKLIADTRAEAARHRTDKQTAAQQAQAAQQQRDAVLKALGLSPDGKDAPPDADTLAKQVADYQAVAWENAAKVVILRAAPAAGADPDALLDSNTFLDSLEEFVTDDPNTPGFAEKLGKHIKDFVAKHTKFKATPAGPARSGGDHPGGGSAPTTRPTSLGAAVKKALGG